MKIILVGIATFFFSIAVHAGVVLQPTGVTTDMGEFGPAWDAGNAIDQSGLSTGYTSGVTDFDTYMASVPTHVVAADNTYFSASILTGNFDVELGGLFNIQSMALWNESQGAGQGVNEFNVYGDVNSDFSTAVLLGSFTAVEGIETASVFALTPMDVSFIRINIISNHGASCCTGIMEVAFEGAEASPLPPATPVPAMSTYGLVLTILGLLFVTSRRLSASARRD